MTDKNLDNYIEWVQKVIGYLREQRSTLRKPDIKLFDLLEVLKNRQYVNDILLAELNRLRTIKKDKETEYEIWYNKSYSKVREEVNPQTLAGTKWLSKTEIHAEVITKHEEDYRKHQKELNDIQVQYAFYESVYKNWSNEMSFDLNNLTKILEKDHQSSIQDNTIKDKTRRPRPSS